MKTNHVPQSVGRLAAASLLVSVSHFAVLPVLAQGAKIDPLADGVAATVKNTAGAIGYVEYVYAAENNLPSATMINKAGKAIRPSEAAFKAAADQADWSKAVD